MDTTCYNKDYSSRIIPIVTLRHRSPHLHTPKDRGISGTPHPRRGAEPDTVGTQTNGKTLDFKGLEEPTAD